MEIAMKSPNHATFQREQGVFRAQTPRTDRPKHLFRPLFTTFGLATASFNGLHPKSKFYPRLIIPCHLANLAAVTIRRGVNKKTLKKELTLRCLTEHHSYVNSEKVARMLNRGNPHTGEFCARVAELKVTTAHWVTHYDLKGYNRTDLYNRDPNATVYPSYLFIPDAAYGKKEGALSLDDPTAISRLKEMKNRPKECVNETKSRGQHVSLMAGSNYFIFWSNIDRQVHLWAPVDTIGDAKLDDLPRVKETIEKTLQHQQEVKS
jgi:hypothetical protein